MSKTAIKEKMRVAQPPAPPEQNAPTPKTADDLLREQMSIDAELDALPGRVQAAKDLASESIDDKVIGEALTSVIELQQKHTTLQIKRWHARKAYLVAAREEALSPATSLQNETVKAREDLSGAEKAVKAAIATRDAADRKFKTLAGQLRGASFRAQQLGAELQKHEQERPTL